MEWWDNRAHGDYEAPGARKIVEVGRDSGEFVELQYWPGLPGLPTGNGLEDQVEWRVTNEPNVPPECRTGYKAEEQYGKVHWYGFTVCYEFARDPLAQAKEYLIGSGPTRKACPGCPFV